MNIIVYLIHFTGHAAFIGDSIDIRYNAIKEIFEKFKSDPRCAFFATSILSDDGSYDSALIDSVFKSFSKKNSWYYLDFDGSEKCFYDACEDLGWDKGNTIIVYCGTNTTGCVLRSLPTSMEEMLNSGWECVLHLPACTEYERTGITIVEQNNAAFSDVFTTLKNYEKAHVTGTIDQLYGIIFQSRT